MLFRAVIYGVDHVIDIVWVDTSKVTNWFKHDGRSYRLDRQAICQVMDKGDRLKATVEALYVEGNPLPLRSSLDVKVVTKEHLKEILSVVSNKPEKSFWQKLRGK